MDTKILFNNPLRQTICFNGDCEQKQQGNTGRSETSKRSANQGHQGLAQLTVPLSLRPPPCLQSAVTLLCGVLTKKNSSGNSQTI